MRWYIWLETRHRSTSFPGAADRLAVVYSYFENGCPGKKVHATIPKGNMGYDQLWITLLLTLQLSKLLLLLSFSTRKHTSTASCAILSNFFEEQRTQNHPQYLSGLSRALFLITFLEIAVFTSELKKIIKMASVAIQRRNSWVSD